VTFPTVSDLEDYLGVELTASQVIRAQGLLAMSAAVVRNYTGQTFDLVEDDVIVLDGSYTDTLYLPQLPVTAVASVTVNGEAVVEDDDWTFTAAGRLRRVGSYGAFYYWGVSPALVTVTYSHGYETLPEDVKLVVLAAATRSWANPTGETSESIGSYSHSWSTATAEQGAGIYLTDAEMSLLNRYRVAVVA
jgi:hypothetical protein